MIDNYGAFKQKTNEAYEEDMIRLSKEGISNGIFIIASGGGYSAAEITSRVGENLSTVLTLSLKDKFEYGDLLHSMQINVLPESGVKGRGLAYYDSRILEYQAALAVEANGNYERNDKIKLICQAMAEKWTGRLARPVPEIPEKPLWENFARLEEYEDMVKRHDKLPIGYDAANATVYGIPLNETFCYGIYGEMQTGKTNLLKMCVLAAIRKKADICIVDSAECDLGMFSTAPGVRYVTTAKEFETYLAETIPNIIERRNYKEKLVAEGKESDEIFEAMCEKFKPLFFFLPELNQFINLIYRSEVALSPLLENFIAKGGGNNFYFIGDLSLKNKANASGYAAFESFIGYKKGIHMGGKVAANNILNFEYMSYSEANKSDKVGVGQLPDVFDEKDTRKVVVPLVKKVDFEKEQ